MPTRTAFVINIGDIIESRPPRRKRLVAVDQNLVDSSPQSPASSTSGVSDQDARPLYSGARPRSSKMKTRTLTSGSGSASNGSAPLSNGCNGVRKGRLLSADHAFGPQSPRTRSGIKQEIDDEVSFVDPVMPDDHDFADEKGTNGESGCVSPFKKKRRSVNEKFLEDNTEYYGFQVLTSKLRSSGEACSSSSTSSSFLNSSPIWDLLHDDKDGERRNRQRHKSASHADVIESSVNGNNDAEVYTTKLMLRRSRTASSSSGNHSDKKHLRVAVDKIKSDNGKRTANSSDAEDYDDEDDEVLMRKSTRKSSVASVALSPSSRKRRSELDKLLEAGSSSFHFETARETATRLNGNELGPIHVDVEDNSYDLNQKTTETAAKEVVAAESDVEEVVEPSAKKKKKIKVKKLIGRKNPDRLLQQADSSAVVATVPKKRGNPEWANKKQKGTPPGRKGRPPKSGRKRAVHVVAESSESRDQDEARRELLEKYLPPNLFEDLDVKLEDVDGSEANVEAMEFSFERTPFRESWFTTYSRQDQGEEILYYPEPKSFPLPYEMPISTFYPKKDGPGGRGDKRGRKRKLLDTEASSTMDSLAASGTATPLEDEPESSTAACDDDPWVRAPPPPPPPPPTRGKRGRPADPRSLANALKRTRALGALENSDSLLSKFGSKAAMAFREFSRKSPRGHASTRSLISAGGEINDLTDSADDIDGNSCDVETSSKNVVPPHLIDECSNDSTFSRFSHVSDRLNPIPELDPASLDEFLREADPDLATGDLSTCTSPVPAASTGSTDSGDSGHLRKKLKRRSSDKRHHHHHKHHRRTNKDQTVPMDDPMDRLVASNVDEVLLDCLEEELPSVTLDGELPGSEPLELVENYNLCDAMLLCSSRKTRPRPFLRTPSTSSSSTLDAKEKQNDESPLSAVANHLAAKRKSKMSTREENVAVDDDVAKEEDSSSEYTSACETVSVASSAPERGKKKKLNSSKSAAKNNSASPRRNSAKVQSVPKMTLKVPSILSAKGRNAIRGGKAGKAVKQTARSTVGKKGRIVPAKKTLTRKTPIKGRNNRNTLKIRRRRSIRKSDDDEEDEEEDEDDESGPESHEVFRLAPSSSKNLKLIVRKKKSGPPPRAASIKVQKPLRVPIRRKKEEVSDNSNEESDEDDAASDDSDDLESVDSEDEPVRESLRIKTRKTITVKRRRNR